MDTEVIRELKGIFEKYLRWSKRRWVIRNPFKGFVKP